MFRKYKASRERKELEDTGLNQACTGNTASWMVIFAWFMGRSPGYAVGRACGRMSPSTGHLFGTELRHPLRDGGLTLQQEG